MKQSTPIRITSFILLAVSGALCQNNLSADRPQGLEFDASDSPEAQRQAIDTSKSLPDAPSAVPSPSQERFRTLGNESTLGGFSVSPGIIRETESVPPAPRPRPSLTTNYPAAFAKGRSSNFPAKGPYTPLSRQKLRYLPSTSFTFMGRATDAASRIFFTRDDSGKAMPNSSYFLGVLASAASARPPNFAYWARSPFETFNNFGSTIGGDAGINILHEFAPGIRQMIKGFTPNFVSRIEERFTQDHTRMGNGKK